MILKQFIPKSICLLLLVQFLNFQGFAQDDWQEGYVITLAGDTLRGMVRDRKTGPFPEMYEKIQLKEKGKGRKRYKASKINGYGWGIAHYVTLYTVSNTRGFKTETFISAQGEPEFYRVISEGPLSLYHCEFMEQGSAALEWIPYFKKQGDPQLVRATQGLLGLKKKLLSSFFADTPGLVKQINEGSLRTPEEVVATYNAMH